MQDDYHESLVQLEVNRHKLLCPGYNISLNFNEIYKENLLSIVIQFAGEFFLFRGRHSDREDRDTTSGFWCA